MIKHFLGSDWVLGPRVQALFQSSPWPGNIRQLINALERAKILADDHVIAMGNLPQELRHSEPSHDLAMESSPIEIGDSISLQSLSEMHIAEVLRRNNGNKAKAARELGIARRSLYRILEKLGGTKMPTHDSAGRAGGI